jgi:hypothetical protein
MICLEDSEASGDRCSNGCKTGVQGLLLLHAAFLSEKCLAQRAAERTYVIRRTVLLRFKDK